MFDAELNDLRLRICKLKIVEFFIYLGIAFTFIFSIIFNNYMCRYIGSGLLCLTIISDLVIENLLYKDFIFLRTEEDDEKH